MDTPRGCSCFALLALLLQVTNALAQPVPPYFYDDFEDGSYVDGSPVTWGPLPWVPGGELVVADGSLVLTPSDEVIDVPGANRPEMDALVTERLFQDLSVRTQFRALDPGLYSIGLTARDTTTDPQVSASYLWAAMDTAGWLAFGSVVDTNGIVEDSDLRVLGSRETGFDPTANDIVLQFDLFGNQISLTAWQDGEPMPARPSLIAKVDSSLVQPGQLELWNYVYREDYEKSVAFRYVSVLPTANAPSIPGDFNSDGAASVQDLDDLTRQIRNDSANLWYDVNYDGRLDPSDRSGWIHGILGTWLGDANLDGEFNSNDLVQVLQSGQYEDHAADNSTWARGDWNGDGEFASDDLVVALQEGGYEQGPRVAVAPVPEPVGLLGLAVGMVITMARYRIR